MSELKTFLELARVVESERRAEEAEIKREGIERRKARSDDAVVGGAFRPKPIDRAAAMLVARSPWWAFAPSVKKQTQEESIMPERLTYSAVHNGSDPALVKKGPMGEDLINMDELALRVCSKIEKNVPKELRALAECAVNARSMLDESIKEIGRSMDEFERVTRDAGQQVRTQRMNIVSECSSTVRALKDVRQFFLGPDYEREQKRLSEFVDLCERLKLLKDSGFLDTVADTMIRLASYDK